MFEIERSAAIVIAVMAGIAGRIMYVDNSVTAATDSPSFGVRPSEPFETIDYAIGQCVAGRGDRIIVGPNHAENVSGASGITLAVEGVTIVGTGQGTNRPTLTFTATASTFLISAANCRVSNIRFYGDIDNLAVFLVVSANNVTIDNCSFSQASAKEYLCGIFISTTYDNTIIRGCTFEQTADPAGTDGAVSTGAIYMVDSENVLIEGCEFRGFFESAFVHNKTTGAKNLWVRNCWGICSLSGAEPFLLDSTATGGAERCSFITPAEAATTEATLSGTFGAGFFNFQSFFGNDGGGGQLAIASQAAAS